MQTVRDRGDQHSVFFVVWPEEKSHESQVSLPSPQHPQEQQSLSLMEAAASSGIPQNTSTTSRDSSSSYRISNSVSPPLLSPGSESLSSKQHVPGLSSATGVGGIDLPRSYSPAMQQPFRAVSAGHQMFTLPAPAIVSLPAADSTQQVLLTSTEQQPSVINAAAQSNHLLEQREHSLLLSTAHKQQLLHMNTPLLTGVPVLQRGQDVDNMRKIGCLAEQAAVNLQKIMQTTQQYYQPVSNQASLHSHSENDQHLDNSFVSPPTAKRVCPAESPIPTPCLDCEVKMAEIQILRKKIHSLQEQVSLLNSRTERVFPSPLLSSTSMESTRVRQATAKPERPRHPVHLSTHNHDAPPFPVEPLSTNPRARKSLDKQSPGHLHTPPIDNQSVVNGNELTELVSGSGVFMLTHYLMEARKDARSGTQLARKLMDVFWDKDTLAKSTLTPRSKFQYQQLDPKTIKAIEVYCLQYDGNVHSKDIHATMTDKCCQARSRIRTHNSDSLIEASKTENVSFSSHS